MSKAEDIKESRSRGTLEDRGFPPELCRHIVHHASTRTLPVLARVCLAFQLQAEKRMYTYLRTDGPTQTTSLCKRLASCTRVAEYVRTLMITLQPQAYPNLLRRGIPNAQEPTYQRPCLESVSRALLNTPRLHTLLFVVDWECSIPPATYLSPLDGAPPRFQLTELKIRCPIDVHFWTFLLGQHQLVFLQISELIKHAGAWAQTTHHVNHQTVWQEPDQELLDRWHPPLNTLQVPWMLLPILIHGRPVQFVRTNLPTAPITTNADLHVLYNSLPQFFEDISKSVGPVLQLDFGELMPDSLSLCVSELAARHLPHLKQIGKLMMPMQEQAHSHFMSSLSYMKNLQIIEIILPQRDPHFFTNAFAQQIPIYASPELIEIVFHIPWEYQRWTKRRRMDTSHELCDEDVPFDEWIMSETGRKDSQYTH